MTQEILDQTLELRRTKTAYVLATVIDVRGSASARPGSKAVISTDGRNLAGWVGGGCAEAFVCAQAIESLNEQRPRVITADLDDEIFGLGMPCGGVMDVYLEPVFPPTHLVLPENAALAERIAWFGRQLGFQTRLATSPMSFATDEVICRSSDADEKNLADASPIEKALVVLAHAIARSRGRSFKPLADVKNPELPAKPVRLGQFVAHPRLWITGRGRITEELARFAAQLEWPVTLVTKDVEPTLYPKDTPILRETTEMPERPGPHDFVVIASHHKGDPLWIQRSLEGSAALVGLIASAHRCSLIRDELRSQGLSEEAWSRVRAPAGLELDCRQPAEIALSLIVEMILLNLAAKGDHDAKPSSSTAH